MKIIHRSEERGENKIDWLDSKFSFSFANYYDPNKMGFGKLKVLNDDIFHGGGGFPNHPHKNMEIITIVTEGVLEHQDSSGGKGVCKVGDIQVMSAGSGIVHSEINHSSKEDLKLFQIWIETKEKDIKPRYEQKYFDIEKNKIIVVASGFNEGLYIHQDAKVCLGDIDKEIEYKVLEGNGVYFFVVNGNFEVDGEKLKNRDAIGIDKNIKIKGNGRFILIEVPLD